jgi:hypothetical protein
MVIDQRNAGASGTANTNFYVTDRFVIETNLASKATGGQNLNSVTPPTGFTKYLGVQSSSAYSLGAGDFFTLRQAIEGYNWADMAFGTANAKTVTLSFWVYSSLTGTFGGSIRGYDAVSTVRSYPFTYTISSANTWTYITITIPGDTTASTAWSSAQSITNGIGLFVNFGLGVGSTYSGTAGSWSTANYLSATGATSVVGTNGATFYVTGVQLEKGSTATSFDYRPYGTELALCQRYCPAWSASGINQNFPFAGQAYLTSAAIFLAPYPVQPRVLATGITTSGTFASSTAAYSATANGTLAIYGTGTSLSAMGLSLTGISPGTLVVGNSTGLLSSSSSALIIATGCEL